MTSLTRLIERARPSRPLRSLPESFLFGVANSDHQTEAYDERFADIRDLWEVRRRQTLRGRGTDFWNRYPEDIELARGLGCQMFRFSVSWSRVEPEPGAFSAEALAHYRDVAQQIRAAGMEPMVTLLHFTWPRHVEERGGMTAPDFPETFARYADEVARALGDSPRYWITLNEPTILPFGYIKPWWQAEYEIPPGLPPGATLVDQLEAVGRLTRNLFLAHTAARAAIKRTNPDALVAANPALLGLPVWLQRLVDRSVTRAGSVDSWLERECRFAERPMLGRGKADLVIASVTRTRSRSAKVDFSDVYVVTGQTLLVLQESTVNVPADLTGKPVAVVGGSTAEEAARAMIPEAGISGFRTQADALQALDQGKVAALLSDEVILRALVRAKPGPYRLTGGLITEESYSVAATKGNTELLKAVDRALAEYVESGGWASSWGQHFPDVPGAVPPPRSEATLADLRPGDAFAGNGDGAGGAVSRPSLTPETSLSRLRKRGRIVIAVRADRPGLGYRDPKTGEWSGFEVDLARAIGRSVLGDSGTVVLRATETNQRLSFLQPLFGLFEPILRVVSAVSSILTTNWWNLGLAGKLPEFLCPRECVGATDFIGFDYYWGISSLRLRRIHHLVQALTGGRFDLAPVWPRGLYAMLKLHGALFRGKPIVIVENGCVDRADGIDRSEYLRRHVREVQRAREDGVDVTGYVCWSITSNREWGLAFGPASDFGLFHVDLDSDSELRRRPTEAAAAYSAIIEGRGA